MDLGWVEILSVWVGYIKLRKDGSGLGRIYQVEKNWNVVEVYISCKGRIGHG